ncbi:HHR168Cp [Eremothecium sinecaudum]|uniref:HHR168Cp n=1 Tax=Eremothecium sinecaudum TaxID=45286 RepID=A0A120K2X8_9SACH|nr:HHR168Cp [Eremothecium sinecaudum]AMD22937.1 HHR168Cp [Eremothecium sinecaudum]
MILRKLATIICLLLPFIWADEVLISNYTNLVCRGMYSKDDWGGKTDPHISFNIKSIDKDQAGVAVAIIEWRDFEFLGVEKDHVNYLYCNDRAISKGVCEESEKDHLILRNQIYDPEKGENVTSRNQLMEFVMTDVGKYEKPYPVKNTGYYCVYAHIPNGNFKGFVEFRNAFGHLPAAEINLLPLYGLLSIAYVVAMALYSFTVWKNKHELLLLQKYLLAFFIFLSIDTIFIWSYYDIKNEKGQTPGTNALMVFISILSAAKLSFSFFLLLVVGLGYGIVYPKLNRKLMRRIQYFTVLNFVVSAAFLIQAYMTDPESTSMLPLITIIPAIASVMGFYFMILRSLSHTLQYLQEQRQVVKLKMYKEFLAVIYISLAVIMAGIAITTFMMLSMSTDEMVEQYWKTRFIMDIWPSIVYYCVFVTLAFLWRPTETSYMLACSQQLPTDPENATEFDLDDLHTLGDETYNAQDHDDDLNFSDDEHNRRAEYTPTTSK